MGGGYLSLKELMMNKGKLAFMVIILPVLFLTLGSRNAHADALNLRVSVDTSGLGQTGPAEIYFVLTDGSGLGDGNNTATLSNFAFGTGGSAGAVDPILTFGDVTKGTDLASGASITDGIFTNVYAGFFTAGTQLSFLLNLTTNVDLGPTPDQFSFGILGPTGAAVPTADPTGLDNLLVINVDSPNPTPMLYSDLITVTPVTSAPEPSSLLLLGIGLLGLVLTARRSQLSSSAMIRPGNPTWE